MIHVAPRYSISTGCVNPAAFASVRHVTTWPIILRTVSCNYDFGHSGKHFFFAALVLCFVMTYHCLLLML